MLILIVVIAGLLLFCLLRPEATADQLTDEAALKARLPALLADFQKDVESLDLIF